jgi:hypothetical protein
MIIEILLFLILLTLWGFILFLKWLFDIKLIEKTEGEK